MQEKMLTHGSSSGIGLETCILFAKEGANVLMADISKPALDKASFKLKQLVPSAHKVDIQVSPPSRRPSFDLPPTSSVTDIARSAMSPKKPI
jgi:NAD(P)-dependent dehydrogenase (short-subunit alcohol dehydrogenase family)